MYAITHPVSSQQLFRLCYSNFIRLFFKLWPAALFMSALLMLQTMMPQARTVLFESLYFVIFVAFTFSINACFLLAHQVLSFQSPAWLEVLKFSLLRLVRTLLVFLVIAIVVFALFALISRLLVVFHVNSKSISLFLFFLIAALVAVCVSLFSSALPLVVIDDKPIFAALTTSLRIARPYPYRCLLLYVIFAIGLVVVRLFTSPEFVQASWLLSLIVHVIVLSLFLPVLFAYYLFLFADLKVRDAILDAAE